MKKNIDGVVGNRTLGNRMEGAYKTTVLWRPALAIEFCNVSTLCVLKEQKWSRSKNTKTSLEYNK